MPELLCLGEGLIEFNRRPQGDMIEGFGGDVSNCAIAASRAGLKSGLWSAVGGDVFGRTLLDFWQSEQIDVTRVATDPQAPTGLYFIDHDTQGHHFTYRRAGSAASRMRWAPNAGEALEGVQILHLSGISQAISDNACDFCFAAIEMATQKGITISYDPNLRLALWPLPRARAIIRATIAHAHIVLPGLEDAQQLTGLTDPTEIAHQFLDDGAKIVALTLGAQGALIATRQAVRIFPAPTMVFADASGAGDCFDGAFLAEWQRTNDPFAAGRYAVMAASLSTTGFGATGPIPRDTDIRAHL